MWRCFHPRALRTRSESVCSTHVEMFLWPSIGTWALASLLHACGDVSDMKEMIRDGLVSAPRMWRCFSPWWPCRPGMPVCSTHVEMFLRHAGHMSFVGCLLHACGDVSLKIQEIKMAHESAPRMWRCFSSILPDSCACLVCSTHVEMFLQWKRKMILTSCLLHACGDVSVGMLSFISFPPSAPRMWRCFYAMAMENLSLVVCSTHVEMFPNRSSCLRRPKGLLHACGDVSSTIRVIIPRAMSAPRMWRCFL